MRKNMWRIAGNTGAVGIEVAVAIVIGYLGGSSSTESSAPHPGSATLGFVAGIGAAIKALVRVVTELPPQQPGFAARLTAKFAPSTPNDPPPKDDPPITMNPDQLNKIDTRQPGPRGGQRHPVAACCGARAGCWPPGVGAALASLNFWVLRAPRRGAPSSASESGAGGRTGAGAGRRPVASR